MRNDLRVTRPEPKQVLDRWDSITYHDHVRRSELAGALRQSIEECERLKAALAAAGVVLKVKKYRGKKGNANVDH